MVDDNLFHDKAIIGLLDSFTRFLGICVEYNIKLHPLKSIIFSQSIRWCGRNYFR